MPRRGRRGRVEERSCAVEGCGRRAKRSSMHCEWHAKSAVGRAARRELKELVRRLEQLQSGTDPELRRRAEGRLRGRLESGAYATLFSPKLNELQAEMRTNTDLGVELASVRLALYRTLVEVEDAVEMARMVVQLSGESRKVVERHG